MRTIRRAVARCAVNSSRAGRRGPEINPFRTRDEIWSMPSATRYLATKPTTLRILSKLTR